MGDVDARAGGQQVAEILDFSAVRGITSIESPTGASARPEGAGAVPSRERNFRSAISLSRKAAICQAAGLSVSWPSLAIRRLRRSVS
jgi:hypothetical protein